MVQGDNVVDAVKDHSDQVTWINLGYLTNKARYDIVTSYLKPYNKVYFTQTLCLNMDDIFHFWFQ